MPFLDWARYDGISVSLMDFVGDFEGDLFVGERDEGLDGFRFSLDMLLLDGFLEEDLEKRLGRTICLLLVSGSCYGSTEIRKSFMSAYQCRCENFYHTDCKFSRNRR